MEEIDSRTCENIRLGLSDRLDGEPSPSVEAEMELDRHLAGCSDCSTWYMQSRSIVDAASEMVQFDVSERLTQDILGAVAKEEERSAKRLSSLVFSTLFVVAAWLLVFVDSFDSALGLVSWIVGALSMVAIKLLVAEAGREKKTA